MYESLKHAPLDRRRFLRRFLAHALVAAAIVLGSLLAGMAGYHVLENLSWIDAFLNAAMLLGGMGPVNTPQTDAGKLFAGIFALYAGLVFVVTTALLVTPVLHRLLHRLHWEVGER